MKKLILPFVAAFFFVACNSHKTTSSETDSKGGSSAPAVDNVNGNVPDTSNTVTLNKSLPKDSSRTDSAHH